MTAAQPEFGVLVVDDDFMVARIHSRFLQTQAGFRVAGVAHTGIDALAKLAELNPDLMLLDVHLPDMSGLEVLRIARQDHPEVDVILVTAERELDSVREAWQGGAMSYLVKPFEYSALAELNPALMLLDVHLPDMSGLEVLRIARQDHPEVDVIVVTAERELDSVRDAWQGGAMSYLVKPFEYTALAQRLDHFRKARAVLETPEVDQSDIDRLFGVGTAPGRRPDLPKGLSRETADLVRRALTTDEAVSATECAERVGISRVSARRYLEYLEQTGVAQVRLKYGKTGRPERLYRLV